MQTSVTELPDSRVRVEVEVPAADVDRAASRAARALAREMRMPGFRKGKAPPSLVIQRLGFGPVLEEAIREAQRQVEPQILHPLQAQLAQQLLQRRPHARQPGHGLRACIRCGGDARHRPTRVSPAP